MNIAWAAVLLQKLVQVKVLQPKLLVELPRGFGGNLNTSPQVKSSGFSLIGRNIRRNEGEEEKKVTPWDYADNDQRWYVRVCMMVLVFLLLILLCLR